MSKVTDDGLTKRELPHGALQELVVSLLSEVGPMTIPEVARITGRTRHVAWEAMKRLHAKRRVHIIDWQANPDGVPGRRARVYALGWGFDKPEPPAKSIAERNAAYRERHRGVLQARSTARRRARGVKPKHPAQDGIWSRLVVRPAGK